MEIKSGYAKSKEVKNFRYVTLSEIKDIHYGQHFFVEGTRGFIRVKINGKPKTWKTRPLDFEIPIKYGLYEYGYAKIVNGTWESNALLVEE